jgi:polygalacturonase
MITCLDCFNCKLRILASTTLKWFWLIDWLICCTLNFYSIGSLGKEFNEGGVENITLTNSIFSGSDNGVRIKSWARPSNGFVRNVVFQNLIMKNVENPIIIDQNYCPNNEGCPRQVINYSISISQLINVFNSYDEI